MVVVHSHRIKIRDAIWNTVEEAVVGRTVLNTGELAGKLLAKYPHCSMTLPEIEHEIIRQIGTAGGRAQIGFESEMVLTRPQRI